MTWVMKITMRSSAGSIQNAVLAAPPHANSPGLPRMWARAADCMTEKPRPKPTPAYGVSVNIPA